MEIALLFIFLVAAVPVVLTLLAIFAPAEQAAWGRRIAHRLMPTNGPYRGRSEVELATQSEPRVVRAASILTALLGGMIVPGGLAAIVGFLFMLITLEKSSISSDTDRVLIWLALSSFSGLVVSFRSLRLFGAMVNNQEDAPKRMRSLATHSGIHNLLLVILYSWYAFTPNAEMGIVAMGTYPIVSLIHVGLLMAAARAIDTRRAAHAEALELAEKQGVHLPPVLPYEADSDEIEPIRIPIVTN